MSNAGYIKEKAIYNRSKDQQTEEIKRGDGSKNAPIRSAILREYNAETPGSDQSYEQNVHVYDEHKFYRINYFDKRYGKEVSKYGYMPMCEFIRGIIVDCIIAKDTTQYQINELLYSDVPTKLYLDLESQEVPESDLAKYGQYATLLVKLIIMVVRELFNIPDFTYGIDQFECTKANRVTKNGMCKFSMHIVVLPQYVFDDGMPMVRHIIKRAIGLCDDPNMRLLLKQTSFVDTSVYGNGRSMRVPYSGKYVSDQQSVEYDNYVHNIENVDPQFTNISSKIRRMMI